jgi:uncharacterized protein (DUF1800 family)
MVKSPIVFIAGSLRTTGQSMRWSSPTWMLGEMGQMPFRPPSVAGWDWGPAWLSSNAMRARWNWANELIDDRRSRVGIRDGEGDPELKPAEALEQALDATGRPWISAHTRTTLLLMARRFYADLTEDWEREPKARRQRATMLQRALRHFLLSGPDAQLH